MKIKGVIFDLDGTLIIRKRSRHWDFMRPPVIPLTALG